MPNPNYFLSYCPLVWTCLLIYRTFLNSVSNCALDIFLPLENVSYEFFAVQLIREERSIHSFASSINNTRPANIPPPPGSTVTGIPAIIESGRAPVSQNPITTRRAKSQHGTSPNFVLCLTPEGSQYITQGTCTRSTNPFH